MAQTFSGLKVYDGDIAYVKRDAASQAATGLVLNGTKVVGVQGAAIIDAVDAATTQTRVNAVLAALRAHGLIAT